MLNTAASPCCTTGIGHVTTRKQNKTKHTVDLIKYVELMLSVLSVMQNIAQNNALVQIDYSFYCTYKKPATRKGT